MHPTRKKRLIIVLFILCGAAIAAALALYALKQNINLYYTPSQVIAGKVPRGHVFRIGGIVEKGSVIRSQKGLGVSFLLTDTVHKIKVEYRGVLPDLFREGQGIVAQGKLNSDGVLAADQVLAKHGADYMPPPAKEAIAAAKAAESAREKS